MGIQGRSLDPYQGAVVTPVKAFFAAKERIAFEQATYTLNFPGRPVELLAEFRSYYGPTMNAYEGATASGRESELENELEALFSEHNENGSEAPTSIPATYLRVTVSV